MWAVNAGDDELRAGSYGARGTDLLVETPYGPLNDTFEQLLFTLPERGYRLLLAHPENNPTFQRSPERLHELVERGVLLQVTARSLIRSDRRRGPRPLAEALVPGRLGTDDRVVGLGWATVDTERTLAHADDALGQSFALRLDWAAPTREAAVGGMARVAPVGDIALVVLEPDTEGRLAAFLARFGEGICLAYVEGEGPGGMIRPTALDVPGRLRPHAFPWGPYLIAVLEPGVAGSG
jgi:hypothetical protein